MLHVLRALIVMEAVLVLIPFLRVLYSHIKYRRWTFAIRDAAASLAVGQALAIQLIRWDKNSFHWYGQTVLFLWILLLLIFLIVRARKGNWAWNKDVEEE